VWSPSLGFTDFPTGLGRNRLLRFRLGQFSDAELKELVAKANKARDEAVARIRAAKKETAVRELAESAAHRKSQAQCADDPVFKLRNEKLCEPSGGFVIPGSVVPEVPEPTAEEYIEGYIMGPCMYAATVREARRIGCLSAK
jgi:hypothetical protein